MCAMELFKLENFAALYFLYYCIRSDNKIKIKKKVEKRTANRTKTIAANDENNKKTGTLNGKCNTQAKIYVEAHNCGISIDS